MKKLLHILLAPTFLIGCVNSKISTQPPKQTDATASVQAQATQSMPTNPATQILYYYPPEGSVAQALGVVSGNFYWQDGCIYLLKLDPDQTIRKRTAMFPYRPEHAVSWDETTKTLILRDYSEEYIFKMGDYISTNGYNVGSSYDPDVMADNEDEKRCLAKDGISFVGTYRISKISRSQND